MSEMGRGRRQGVRGRVTDWRDSDVRDGAKERQK